MPTTSYTGALFTCPDPNLYTQMYKGVCYALVGLHISSKALPDWLWATFDPWGTTSSAPYGKGQTVPQSQPLQQLMSAAGLNPVLKNYYLTGVQTQFVDGNGKPVPLGSSFIEFNASVAPGQASCITSHKYAYFDGKDPGKGSPEDNFGGSPGGGRLDKPLCSTSWNPTMAGLGREQTS